jgi:hypothetical protein
MARFLIDTSAKIGQTEHRQRERKKRFLNGNRISAYRNAQNRDIFPAGFFVFEQDGAVE